jgi:hypothetical protein
VETLQRIESDTKELMKAYQVQQTKIHSQSDRNLIYRLIVI